ncbi:Glycosyl hydrolases family 18 [Caloramator quimbayensis]|uniref:Glycosyl hydrolases family 18 n=1 Tax=Caloramator quimbayensis TaxID=1147123 RepID=A0A1T4WNX0_9CLOT|nr:glycosyl hydrolase family 18 protein [Caloramator quimbayensis]SKA78578.1 Glycosyl hydrolases family 18 [Caloramator quimbayensis]
MKRLKSSLIIALTFIFLFQINIEAFAAAKFQSYKAIVIAQKLYIRKTPSSKGKITGSLSKGQIVDIIGASGKYLKTPKGYIYSSYVKKYIPPKLDVYVSVKEDMPLLLSPDGDLDERYAVEGKKYKVTGDTGGYYKIDYYGKLRYIPKQNAQILKGLNYKDNITLGFIYVNGKQYNQRFMDDEKDYVNRKSTDTGLDVLCPTWFEMSYKDDTVDIVDKGDSDFVKTAHKNGYQVWATFFESSPERASRIFSDDTLSSNIIDNIIKYAKDYNIDGINIDFEGLGLSNKDGFTKFVSKFYNSAKYSNLLVSIDITKPEVSSYNFYNRAELSKYCNYMILMAYGEHGGSFKEAGSVASYNWTEKAISDTLNFGVPKDKLILGVPFYTYDYAVIDVNLPYDSVVLLKKGDIYTSEVLSDEAKNKDIKYGTFKYISSTENFYKVSDEKGENIYYIPLESGTLVKANTIKRFVVGYESLKLQTLNDRMSENNGTAYYDESVKQYIAEYYKDNLKHTAWVENKDTLSWRIDLLNKYNLKGLAAWQLYYETEDMLKTIKDKLNK